MVLFCVLVNSYITVVNSPGCTSTLLTNGRNFQTPRELASNSTVIVRLESTWEFPTAPTERPDVICSDRDNTLMPSAVQTAR